MSFLLLCMGVLRSLGTDPCKFQLSVEQVRNVRIRSQCMFDSGSNLLVTGLFFMHIVGSACWLLEGVWFREYMIKSLLFLQMTLSCFTSVCNVAVCSRMMGLL